MAIYTGVSGDSIVDGCLSTIRSAEFGRDAREPIASAVDRCYKIAVARAGTSAGNVTQTQINEHLSRIRTAVFGEEVRDALKTGLTLCYTARAISMPTAESNYLTNLINAQTSEDFKNAILQSIAGCCQDVRT